MECFEQSKSFFYSNKQMMKILNSMGKNMTISARLWKEGNYSENNVNSLRAWIKTIKRIENQMAFNLGL
jgi:hypothetical protein